MAPRGQGCLLGVAAGVLAHAATQRVSVTQIASVVSQRAGALADTVIGWATEVLSREDQGDGAEAADVMVAREILALPMVSSATEASQTILDALSEPRPNELALVSSAPWLELPEANPIPSVRNQSLRHTHDPAD